jgi:signal transduction histidine kinase
MFAERIGKTVPDDQTINMPPQQILKLNETLEKQLSECNCQLRRLASELASVEQRARKRVARCLHDDLQQLLVATRLKVTTARERVSDRETASLLEKAVELLNRSLAAARGLALDLAPPVLCQASLIDALEWLADHMKRDYSLLVKLDVEDIEPLAVDRRLFLFHAVQELLFNVVKHAGTDHATVRIKVAGSLLQIDVEDSGAGLTFDAAGKHRQFMSFGLSSIRERAMVLGGALRIHSVPGQGFRATITISQSS